MNTDVARNAVTVGLLWIGLLSAPAPTQAATQPSVACADAGGTSFASVDAATTAIACRAVRGRLLIVGELHGTRETPELVARLLRAIGASRPTSLGLEIPVAEQGALQTYIDSPGGATDKAALLRGPFWRSEDGRSSGAMLQLIDQVRQLRAGGVDVTLFAMEPAYPSQAEVAAGGGFLVYKEQGIAAAIGQRLARSPTRFVIALMGNYHSRYQPASTGNDRSVSERLQAMAPYIVLPVAAQGAAWNCKADGCAAHPWKRTAPVGPGVTLEPQREVPTGLTVVKLWLPTMTASLPAGPTAAAR